MMVMTLSLILKILNLRKKPTLSVDRTTPTVGASIDVYWPLDDQCYPGYVINIGNDMCTINYDDGDLEVLDIK